MTLSTRRRSSIPRYSSREADFDEIALQFSFALLGFVKGSSVLRAYTLFIRDMRRRGRLVTVHRAETILSRGWRCFSLYCQVFYLLRVSASWEKKKRIGASLASVQRRDFAYRLLFEIFYFISSRFHGISIHVCVCCDVLSSSLSHWYSNFSTRIISSLIV